MRLLSRLSPNLAFSTDSSLDKDGGGCPFRALSTTIVDGNVDYNASDPDLEQIASERGSFLIWDEDPKEVTKHPPRWSN